MSEIRYSKLFDEYTLIAPERYHKPNEVLETKLDSKNCPFCAGNENQTTKEIFSIKKNGKWVTRVIPNLYTALNLDTKIESQNSGFFESFSGFGAHEIIIDTNRHIREFDFEIEEFFNLLKAIQIRTIELTKDIRLKYLTIFKNSGIKAGASQPHPHTQIIASNIISNFKRNFYKREFKYYQKHSRKLLIDIIKEEKNIILENNEFKAVFPYASFFPFEVIIAPINGDYSIKQIDDNKLNLLAETIKLSLNLIKTEIGEFDFNIEFLEPPINENFDNEKWFKEIELFHSFFVRITPRIFNLAGFEISTHININPVLPETAKKAIDDSLY